MSMLGPFSVKVQKILRALNQIFKSNSFPGPSLIIGTTFVKRASWPGLPDWLALSRRLLSRFHLKRTSLEPPPKFKIGCVLPSVPLHV